MMRMKTKGTAAAAFIPMKESTAAVAEDLWEVRPCGMLVQKRNPDSDDVSAPAPTIQIRVKYGAVYHEIYVNPQSTFGELKKTLSACTGLHPLDQKVVFKDKERESTAYLDVSGVKNRSKMVVLEDPTAQAKRFLEMRRTAKMEKASKSIAQISLDVDKLASQVSAFEAIISKGGKVVERDLLNLIELLMNQLIKLDAINADGDAKLQRRVQVRRVQKNVESLDVLKIKNAMQRTSATANGQKPMDQQQKKQAPPPVVVKTKWEEFDALFSPTTSSATSAKAITTAAQNLDWELF